MKSSFTALFASIIALLLVGCTTAQQTTDTEPAEQALAAQEEGIIELEWQTPDQRLDGEPLESGEIAGYRIYVGENPGQYSRTIEVDDPTQTSYQLRGLEAGEDYFVAISTIDRDGRESPKSDEITMAAAPLSDSQFAHPDQQERRDDQRAGLD